ncbi:hypothetical protein [Bacteroides nordii]|uniref:hypothetical protein n=1 Tax=Bacteroides nordii TaxID=291645 RepID=UPI00241E4C41|nr:hypothetical protein [Bacteroides nordii]MBD9108655.1 hypothetical protein [Bacteroides nordii]
MRDERKTCAGCVYFDVCGDSDRTEPCAGRKAKRKYIVKRFLAASAVMRMCQAERFYTCGTTEDYDKMLALVDAYGNTGKLADAQIGDIAEDIYNHSDQTETELVDVYNALLKAEQRLVLIREE